MSTHTLTGTINSGASTSFQAYWGGYYTTTASSNNKYVGKASGDNMFYACNITFDATTLSSLRAKTKTSMSLTVSGNGYLYAQGTTTYWPVRYKKTSYQKTNSATADNTRDPWRSSNAASTADSTSNITYLTSLSSSASSGSFTKTYDISSASVPVYGFCIGPHNNSLTRRMTLSSASLTIVIPDYTVTYKPGANGTGSQQTGTKEYGDTLTLKGAIFTRTGYTQTGWATSDGGAQAYSLGGSYTANANQTLYPVWTPNVLTIYYHANGGVMADAHGSEYAIDNEGYITRNGERGFHTINYDSSDDPFNINNSSAINLIRIGYQGKSGAEWNTSSDGTGTSFNQATSYTAQTYRPSLSSGNQTITLYVNWEVSSIIHVKYNGAILDCPVYIKHNGTLYLGIVYTKQNGTLYSTQ